MRQKELNKVKELIKEFYDEGQLGLYNCRNIAGDPMMNLFTGYNFTLDICLSYSYFEVFGTTQKEFNELMKFYDKLGGN